MSEDLTSETSSTSSEKATEKAKRASGPEPPTSGGNDVKADEVGAPKTADSGPTNPGGGNKTAEV